MDTVYYHLYSPYTWVTSDELPFVALISKQKRANLYKNSFG